MEAPVYESAASVPASQLIPAAELKDDETLVPRVHPTRVKAEALGEKMVELCAHITAAKARFLELLAEFDREQLWGVFGCNSAAHWLNWKCGIGTVAARERVRVARALEQLPKIREAFRRGEVSYSKVREMTRIAIPETEEPLLMVARHGTAAHMQRLVRKYRLVERLEAAGDALEQYRNRYVRCHYDLDGMFVIEARLPPEVGSIVEKALDAAMEVMYRDAQRKRKEEGENQGAPQAEPDTETETETETETAHANDVEFRPQGEFRLRDGVDVERPIETESNVSAEVRAAEDQRLDTPAEARPASGQRRNVSAEAWSAADQAPVDVPAEAEACSLSSTEIESSQRHVEPDIPAEAFSCGIQTESNVPAEAEAEAESGLAPVPESHAPATQTPHDASAEAFDEPPGDLGGADTPRVLSQEVPFDSLGFEGARERFNARRADALRLLAESFLARGAERGERVDTSADRYQVVVHIDQRLLASGSRERQQTNRPNQSTALFPRCEIDDERALAIDTARRLACDASLVGIVEDKRGEPLNVGRKTRAISPALRRALQARDGGCRFPGCCRTRFTQYHHIIHWANGGETKLDNLITLCIAHHMLLHEGKFSVERLDDGSFAFFSPWGERLSESDPIDRRTADALAQAAAEERVTLTDMNADLGLEIDETTIDCLWTGEQMDYGMAVGGLFWVRDQVRAGWATHWWAAN